MATEKRRRIIVPTTTTEAPQLKAVEDMARAYRELEALARKQAAELAHLKALRTGPLDEKEIEIGMHVAARIGTGDYVPAEVTEIYTPVTGGERYYALRRLDDAKKGLNLKPAAEIYPPERAAT
jgi:hypothetical protein